MQQQQEHPPHADIRKRYVNKTLLEFQEANRNPIYGYEAMPLKTLEEATETVTHRVSGLSNYVARAKQECNKDFTILTLDESAAIYLYSMPTPFHYRLNKSLRIENRDALKPWFSFLKLFTNALEKLPSNEKVVWRGISENIGSNFSKNNIYTWWSINSCSTDLEVAQMYLGKQSSLFVIQSVRGKEISPYSSFPNEHEVVLLPGTCLRVQSNTFNFENRLFIVHLEEVTQSNLYKRHLSKSI
ncbi:unnamed protein product [Rotaria sp. Silwood2]|nr:unnamed protein product [Rotaria sp. Silwood2]CAF4748878.1 unnamed protein product [Rotaria sp. Silwood2]